MRLHSAHCTYTLEDGAELVACGQARAPGTDHVGIAGDLISVSAELHLLAETAELIAKVGPKGSTAATELPD